MAFPLINFWHWDFKKDDLPVTSQDLGPFSFAAGNMSPVSRGGQSHGLAAASPVSQE